MAPPQDEVLAFLELDIPDLPFDTDVLSRLEANEVMPATLQAEINAGREIPRILARQEAIEAFIRTSRR
jgi:hypothetical protein